MPSATSGKSARRRPAASPRGPGRPGPRRATGQPLELVAEGGGHLRVERGLERLQGAAQAPRRHPHLVHGFGVSGAYPRVLLLDGLALLPGVPEHGVDLAAPRRGEPVAERPGQLRRPGRGGGAGGPQQALDRLQHLRPAVDQLDLELLPVLLTGVRLGARPGPGRSARGCGRRRRAAASPPGACAAAPPGAAAGSARWLRTSASSSAGTSSPSVSGIRCSVRLDAPAGVLRCQPASPPPLRRRRVRLLRASRRSSVSK